MTMRKISLVTAMLTALVAVTSLTTHLFEPLERWSEAAEVIALDRFVPDIFGPAVPIVRLRLDNGQLVVAPLPNDVTLKPGHAVNLIASRTRLGRTEYRVCQIQTLQPEHPAG